MRTWRNARWVRRTSFLPDAQFDRETLGAHGDRRGLRRACRLLCVHRARVGGRARSARSAPFTLTPLATYLVASAPCAERGRGLWRAGSRAAELDVTPPPEALPAARLRVRSADRSLPCLRRAQHLIGRDLAPLRPPSPRKIARRRKRRGARRIRRLPAARRGVLGWAVRPGRGRGESELGDRRHAPGVCPEGAASPRFTGLHRIEYGLWTDARHARSSVTSTRSLPTCASWRMCCPGPRSRRWNTRRAAHETLEDATRDFLSGMDVPWSGEGVLATDAGLHATEEVIATLRPLLHGAERVIPAVDTELRSLRGRWPRLPRPTAAGCRATGSSPNSSRSARRHDRGGAEALSQVPGVLETEAPPQIPRFPSTPSGSTRSTHEPTPADRMSATRRTPTSPRQRLP